MEGGGGEGPVLRCILRCILRVGFDRDRVTPRPILEHPRGNFRKPRRGEGVTFPVLEARQLVSGVVESARCSMLHCAEIHFDF